MKFLKKVIILVQQKLEKAGCENNLKKDRK